MARKLAEDRSIHGPIEDRGGVVTIDAISRGTASRDGRVYATVTLEMDDADFEGKAENNYDRVLARQRFVQKARGAIATAANEAYRDALARFDAQNPTRSEAPHTPPANTNIFH